MLKITNQLEGCTLSHTLYFTYLLNFSKGFTNGPKPATDLKCLVNKNRDTTRIDVWGNETPEYTFMAVKFPSRRSHALPQTWFKLSREIFHRTVYLWWQKHAKQTKNNMMSIDFLQVIVPTNHRPHPGPTQQLHLAQLPSFETQWGFQGFSAFLLGTIQN